MLRTHFSIGTNLCLDDPIAQHVLSSLRASLIKGNSQTKKGVSHPLSRVKPFIYLDVMPSAEDDLFDAVPPNPYHTLGHMTALYETVHDTTDAVGYTKPRITILHPGDDRIRRLDIHDDIWAASRLTDNSQNLALEDAQFLTALATAQGLASTFIREPYVHVMTQSSVLYTALAAAGDSDDKFVANLSDLFAQPIMDAYNHMPRRRRNVTPSHFIPTKQHKPGPKFKLK